MNDPAANPNGRGPRTGGASRTSSATRRPPAGDDEAFPRLDAIEEGGGISLEVLQADGIHGHYYIRAGRSRGGRFVAFHPIWQGPPDEAMQRTCSRPLILVVRRQWASATQLFLGCIGQ